MRFWTPMLLAGCLIAAASPARAQQSLLGDTGASPQPGAPQPGAPQPGAPQPGAPQPGAPQPLAPQVLGPPVAVAPAPPVAAEAPAAPAPVVIAPPPPPGLVQTPMPPANADAGAAPAGAAQAGAQPDAAAAPVTQTAPAANAAAVPSTADSMPPPLPNNWVPRKTAALGILDKVDGSIASVTIPVGGQSTIGDLLVNVLACVSRPDDEVPDDAIFVSIQPVVQSDGGPIFRGWMLRSLPGATVVGDASETFRVAGCG